MPTTREVVATLVAALALAALALAVTARPVPQGVSVRLSASQGASGACDYRVFHRIDKYTSWRYVSPRLARQEHVGRCSKVITGTDGSIIFSERGYVIDVS